MRQIFRAITFFVDRYQKNPKYTFELDREPPIHIYAWNILAGHIYYRYKRVQEFFRIWSYNRINEFKSILIDLDILKHSSRFLLYLFLVFLIGISALFLWKNNFDITLDNVRTYFDGQDFPNTVKLLLEIIIGATAAIMGLIFALYAVGFQLSTEKYSGDITNYINQEKVGNHYIKLLIATILFSLFTLIYDGAINGYPLFFLIGSIFLFILSLSGVAIFKDHYVISIKPTSVFKRIYVEAIENLNNMNTKNSPTIKSFIYYSRKEAKDFSVYLNPLKSWNLVISSRKKFSRLTNLNKTLFYDLINIEKYEDAFYGLISMANITQRYCCIKRYFDQDNNWAYPEKWDLVKADDKNMYTIKSSYESQQIGRLFTKKPDNFWFESYVVDFYNEAQSDKKLSQNKKILSGLLHSYEIILVGEYTQNEKGFNEKTILSAYENEEFFLDSKIWELFCNLYNLLESDKELLTHYNNILFAYGQLVVNEKDLNPFQKAVSSIVGKGRITRAGLLHDYNLPTFAFEIANDFRERIETEQLIERKIITPTDWLVKEATEKYLDKLSPVNSQAIVRVLEFSNKMLRTLIEKRDFETIGYIIKLQFMWIGRAIYLGDWDKANLLSKKMEIAQKSILLLSKSVAREIELREELERGLLSSLIGRKKELFTYYLKSYLWSLLVLKENNSDKETIAFFRLPLIIGSISLLVSEIDQNKFYINAFLSNVEEKFYQAGSMISALDAAFEIKKYLGMQSNFNLIYDETQRFNQSYQQLRREIEMIPKVWDGCTSFYNECADHPSTLIKKISRSDFYYDLDWVAEDFVDWLKKRELVKKLIGILGKKK